MKIKSVSSKEAESFLNKEWKKIDKQRGVVWKETGKNLVLLDEKGRIAAASKFSFNGGLCHLKEIVVKEDARGRGYGELLLQATEEKAKKGKCHKIQLVTSRLNGKALEFYKKCGYKVEAELKNDYFHVTKYILMKKL